MNKLSIDLYIYYNAHTGDTGIACGLQQRVLLYVVSSEMRNALVFFGSPLWSQNVVQIPSGTMDFSMDPSFF